MPHYHIDDDCCKAQGIDGNLNRLVMSHLYEPVNDDKD